MKKNYLFGMTLAALFIFTFSACSGGASTSLTGKWKLISYGDASNPTPAVSNVEASISFDEDGQFGGNVGCNGFGADYEVSGDKITFGSIMSTMMFCEETSSQEGAVLGILSDKTVNFEIDGEQLTITSKDGALIIILTR